VQIPAVRGSSDLLDANLETASTT